MNLIEFIFPPICQGCGQIGNWLCNRCKAELEFFPNPVAIDPSFMTLKKVQAITYLQTPIRELILALKYKKYPKIGVWLGNWILEVIQPPNVNLISWVPLHPARQKWRGFNQAEIIARTLAKNLNLPCGNLIQKISATSSQAQTQTKTVRLTHLESQFCLSPIFQQSKNQIWLKNQKILLIDDVITTGATLNAVAKPLAIIGVEEIHGLAIAHGQ